MYSLSLVVVVLLAVLSVSMAQPSRRKMNFGPDLANETPLVTNNATDTVTGRGRMKNTLAVILPLLASYKATALTSASFTALKIFIIQTLGVATVALVGAALVLARSYLLGGLGFQKSPSSTPEIAGGWELYSPHSSGMYAPLQENYVLPSTQDNLIHNRRTDGNIGKPVVVGYNTVIKKTTTIEE